MKKMITVCFVLFTQNNFGQNVGIGTASPQTNLHLSSAGSTIIRNESTAGFEASLELKTSGAFFDFLEFRKWKTGAGGSLASIPLDGLSQITTGAFTTGGLLLGTKSSYPLYFTSNNIERMRIDANGNVGINTGSVGIGTNVFVPNTKLQILNNDETYMSLQSSVNNKGIGYVAKNSAHEWVFGLNLGNYTDGRFNLFHTATPGTVSQYLTVTATGNVGIGDYGGLLVEPTERLEIKDGFIKVSGTNKTAFTHTATTANSSGHVTTLSYANQSATDLVFITHNFSPPSGFSQYLNVPTGVYFSGGTWRIYNEDQSTAMFASGVGKSFNVMVIKQ